MASRSRGATSRPSKVMARSARAWGRAATLICRVMRFTPPKESLIARSLVATVAGSPTANAPVGPRNASNWARVVGGTAGDVSAYAGPATTPALRTRSGRVAPAARARSAPWDSTTPLLVVTVVFGCLLSLQIVSRPDRFHAAPCMLMFIIALARPQYGMLEEESGPSSRSLIVGIDTSRSMLTDDLKPNRLTRTQLAATDLVKRLRGMYKPGKISINRTHPLCRPYRLISECSCDLE